MQHVSFEKKSGKSDHVEWKQNKENTEDEL
jgi:hypothetical protein